MRYENVNQGMEQDVLPAQGFSRDFMIPGLFGDPVCCDIFHFSDRKKEAEEEGGALIFVHGGGFVGGDKDQFLGMASWLALTAKVLCITVQYRFAKTARGPAAIEDCLSVFQWLWDNQKKLRVNPDLVFLVGGSPGAAIGGIAMMAGKQHIPGLLWNPDNIFRPDNGIFLNGIYDLSVFYQDNPAEQERVQCYLGMEEYNEERAKLYSPMYQLRPGMQILMLHGEQDQIVSVSQCEKLKERAEALGGRAWVRVFPGKGHAWFNQAEEQYEVLLAIKEFVQMRRKEVLYHGIETAG